MTDAYRTDRIAGNESNQPALSWAAIVAGGITIAALTLVLLAFGSGMGFSAVSPWSNSGISAGTFEIAAGIYMIVVAMLSSTVGGYIAGRVRTRWVDVHTDEVMFRDTAHGFLSWALATVLGAAALGGAATYMVGGVVTGAAQGSGLATTQPTANEYFVDMLFRPASQNAGQSTAGAVERAAAQREAQIVLSKDLSEKADFPAADRAYLAQLVSARTGLPAAAAEMRVSDVIDQSKAAADRARKSAAALSMWLTAAMFAGAFSAALAAIEGGQLRDGRWKGIIGGKNYQTVKTN
jgi:hypothetical protein